MKSRSSFMIALAVAIGMLSLVTLVAAGRGLQGQRGRATKADLSGPAPRLPNGKPSMSGVWGQVRRADVTDSHLPGYVKELPYTEWGKKQWESYDAGKGDYAGTCLQARSVGGDYYDFLDLGQERLGLVVADVAGKGMAAALLMANLQANLRSQCAIALEQPERLLRSVNDLFYANTVESVYATLFFAEYDDRLGRLRYANCGHLPAVVLRTDDSIERLHSTSTVLGLFPIWDCVIGECQLLAGDAFALYTDGITESCNDDGQEFGEERLIEALRRHRKLSSKNRMRAIVEDVRHFCPREQQDDITLIVGLCTGS